MDDNQLLKDIENILIDKKWNYERIFSTIACKLNDTKQETLICIDTNQGLWFIKKHTSWERIECEKTVDWILNDWVSNFIKLKINNELIDNDEILNVLKFTSFVTESRQLFYNTSLPF